MIAMEAKDAVPPFYSFKGEMPYIFHLWAPFFSVSVELVNDYCGRHCFENGSVNIWFSLHLPVSVHLM